MAPLSWFCIIFGFQIGLLKDAECGPKERDLIQNTLLKNYNSLERPVKNESHSLKVSFGLTFNQLVEVMEKQEMIKTNMWINIEWHDANLVWDPAEHGNVSVVMIQPNRLWKPDVLLYNSAADGFDTTFATNLVVRNTGSVVFLPPGMLTSTCKFDIRWFPFDEQNCHLKFGSWTHDGTMIDLQLNSNPSDVSTYQENGAWQLISMTPKRNVEIFQGVPYVDITYTITIRRKPLYYAFNLVYPCVLISAMALLTFNLPPEAGEKIGLAMNILLCLMMFSLLVAEKIPASETIPLLGLYFACIMMMSSACVVVTILILNYHHRNADTHHLPNWVKVVICQWLAWVLRMKRPGTELSRQMFMSKLKLNQYLTEMTKSDSMPFFSKSSSDFCSEPLLSSENASKCGAVSDISSDPKSVFGRYQDLYLIYKELKYLTDRWRDEDKAKEINDDFTFAAMVLDRLNLLVFLMYTVITTCAILFSAPHVFS